MQRIQSLTKLFMLSTLALLAHSAWAQNWNCLLTPQSVYNQTTNIATPLAGTWIGNYNATTNPTGTRTLPGLWGGSGNTAIPFSSTVKSAVSISNTHPTGGFVLSLDRNLVSASAVNLNMDMLAGQSGSISTSMLLTYANFHTVAPTSLYPGVSNVSVPLASDSLTVVTAIQEIDVPAAGTASANTDGTWNFSVAVPVTITLQGTALGQPFVQQGPAVVALTGLVTFNGDQITVTSNATISDTSVVPAPPPLVNTAFDLPTILPAGQTAHLLINGTFTDGTSTTSGSVSITASGARIFGQGDFDESGSVDSADLALLFLDFGVCSGCATDLDGSGEVDLTDLGLELLLFE